LWSAGATTLSSARQRTQDSPGAEGMKRLSISRQAYQ